MNGFFYMGKRLRNIIRTAVARQTDVYRKDNLLIIQHYMEEQKRRSELDESIRYAQGIQSALFPNENNLRQFACESFVFSLPRNSLNGDFFWCHMKDGQLMVAVADCTGHGIPGALMAVLGLSLLNQCVLEENCTNPSEILQRIDEKLHANFQHSGTGNRDMYDGMDIGLCLIDYVNARITYAGAMRQAWLLQPDGLKMMKGSRYPIGGLNLEQGRDYPSVSMDFSAGDMLYLFTDGYTDQFGGPSDKKISTGRLRELLGHIHHLPVKQQKEQLMEFFILWKADKEQTDDTTMMGIKL